MITVDFVPPPLPPLKFLTLYLWGVFKALDNARSFIVFFLMGELYFSKLALNQRGGGGHMYRNSVYTKSLEI